MRLFEKILKGNKIIFIDLTFIETRFVGKIDIQLGIKVETNWKTISLLVEEDFTIDEFKETCTKCNIEFSVFCGDKKEDIQLDERIKDIEL